MKQVVSETAVVASSVKWFNQLRARLESFG